RPLEHLDRGVVAALHLAPQLVRLREEVVRVDREDARVRLQAEEQVEEHALLLLEGARERDPAGKRLETEADDVLRAQRLDVRRKLQAWARQAAPPSGCHREGRAAASRAGSPR